MGLIMFKEEQKVYLHRAELFLKRIQKDKFKNLQPLTAKFARSKEMVKFKDRLNLTYKSIGESEDWGSAWDSAWFNLSGVIPETWQLEDVVLQLNLSGEAQLFDDDGVPVYAVTGNSIFNVTYFKDLVFLPSNMIKSNREVNLWVEAAANSLFGVKLEMDPHNLDLDFSGKFEARVLELRIGELNREVFGLIYDFEVLLSLLSTFSENSYRYKQILINLNQAVSAYGNNSDNAAISRAILAKELSRNANSSSLKVSAIGHAHIDVGWLWEVKESIRKAGRTFSSQIELMKLYPEYKFGASQAQLYSMVKEHYPEIFEEIKKLVKAKRWEIQGGMWVEADCNISGGESLVRQFVHGKNFFMDEFQVDVNNLWLPDVFGYSAALPQMIKKSNCEYFLTQKISWNNFNKFPHHTFIWEGIDRSQVLTHFPPENDYNSFCMPDRLIGACDNYSEAATVGEFASLVGIGDGGGGASEGHLERARRVKNLEGVPRVEFSFIRDFFERANEFKDELAVWSGELYLEMHRGTLTTQANVKKGNRKLEELLMSAEAIFSMFAIEDYPSLAMDKLWKVVLLNQFHDIIPGSSIKAVYDTTLREYAEANDSCLKLINEAIRKNSVSDESYLSCINTLSFAVKQLIKLPAEWQNYQVVDSDNKPVKSYINQINQLIAEVEMAGNSIKTLFRTPDRVEHKKSCRKNSLILENELVLYEFNDQAQLIKAYDKEAKRSLILESQIGNEFTLYVDRPNLYEAWDVDVFYPSELTTKLKSCKLVSHEESELESILSFEMKISNSKICQQIHLTRASKRLDFVTQVDWRENRQMLKVAFENNVTANEASFDIQYGFLKRPIHVNTSVEMAKFEVVAYKYVDLSEGYYGVALLNDCKYGHRVLSNMMELTLLRAPMYPDETADRGKHEFIYSYLPHTGRLIESNCFSEAASLNRPIMVIAGYKLEKELPFSLLETNKVELTVTKKAEKSNQLVARLVERAGESSEVVLKSRIGGELKVYESNLLEWSHEQDYEFINGELSLTLKPFEIKTLIFCRG